MHVTRFPKGQGVAEWFRCRPTKLLRGLAGLSEDAQLAYVKALCLIYENDGRIHVRALRSEFPQWRPKRLDRAVAECLDAGKLIGTATGDLHNDYAMHELQQLGELNASRAAAGSKGGRTRAERERYARRIAERNRSPDLPLNLPEKPVETPLKPGSIATQPDFKSNLTDIENDYADENPNKINGRTQATLKHARAGEEETETEEEYPLSVPPIEIDEVEVVEGVVISDAPRGRKQPMPPGWVPTLAGLSDRVADVVQTWPEEELHDQQTKFMEWAEATDQRFVKWDRAFGNWCMKHNEQRRRTGRGRQSGWAQARS
jgi:hypothetical protein